jgi:hypothetical protein
MLKYLIAALAIAALIVPAAQADWSKTKPDPAAENAVSKWSLIAQNAITAPPPGSTALRPPASSEVLHGLVHAAMYDAVVAIDRGYEPFAVSMRAPKPTSIDAAVAAAARGILVARVPAQAAVVEAEYAAFLAGIRDHPMKTKGIRLGTAIADAYIDLRAGDGYDNVVPWVQPPIGPGVFEPLVPGSQPVDAKLQQVRPLSFGNASMFDPGPPHPLTSPQYAADFNEVKALGDGRPGQTTRTAEQTQIARFWTEHPMIQYNRVLRALALAERLDVVETARMMAMVHVAAADTQVGCWWAKHRYVFWRPIHAIRRADTDGNAATTADPGWTHLVAGNHPEHPSGHQCITSAQMYALEAYFGTDSIPLDIQSLVTGTTRHFEQLGDIRREVTLARIYGGLHFRKAMEASEELGKDTAEYVAENFFGKS